MACRGFKRRCRKADQIETGHHAGQCAEPTVERRGEMERRRLAPIDQPRDDRQEARQERQSGRRCRDRNHHARDPFDATKIQTEKEQHQSRRNDFDGQVGQIPLMDRRGREQSGQAAGRNPAPPIPNAGEICEDGAVRAKRFRTGRGDAADPVRKHDDEFDPTGRRRETEKQPYNQQGDGSAALSRNSALADEEGRDEEETLIAAAHRQRSGSDPTDRARVRRVFGCIRLRVRMLDPVS